MFFLQILTYPLSNRIDFISIYDIFAGNSVLEKSKRLFIFTSSIKFYLSNKGMFRQKNKFSKKTIGNPQMYTQYIQTPKQFSGWAGLAKMLIIICCILVVFFVWKYFIQWAKILGWYLSKWTITAVSNTVWDEMVQDELWNINVMILGFGGGEHAWGYLADSIMVASFNPKLNALTMISIPRDLYVYNSWEDSIGKINALFSHNLSRKLLFATWAKILADKLEEITWLRPNYYVMFDFDGFQNIIDTLGWITIDVPEVIHDVTYPSGEGWNVMTVHFDTGAIFMSGARALQYARSRHSSSDFSRSLRQQLIVKAVINKFFANWFSNLGKVKQLYQDYSATIHTNISFKEMLGMVKYSYKLKNIFSFGYTSECSNITYKYSFPGCFLYTPPQESFWWASVLIPDGWIPNQISFYEYTKNFWFIVAHNQEYLIENPQIEILNGIDKVFAKQTVHKSDWFANQMAVKLRKYAFEVPTVGNFYQSLTGTTIFVLGTGNYNHTIKTLKYFIDIKEVITEAPVLQWQYTGIDLLLVLGNDYISKLATTPFNYYK